MRKIIHGIQDIDAPVDINQVSLEYVHVVAINKYSPHIKGFILNYTDGLGIVFPQRQTEYNSAVSIRRKDLPSLIKALEKDYDFYVL